MKKYLIGFFVGVVVASAVPAYADEIESIVGRTIQGQFPVKVAGKQLDKQAAVVDGTSYLPVRAIGEALDMDVSFDSSLGIELKPKETNAVEQTPAPTIQEQIDILKKNLTDEQDRLKTNEGLRDVNFKVSQTPGWESAKEAVEGYDRIIAEIKARIADYEKQIAELEAQIQ